MGFTFHSDRTRQGKGPSTFTRSLVGPRPYSPIDALDATVSIFPEKTTDVSNISPTILSSLSVQDGGEIFALSPKMTVIVFIIGVIPFAIGTYEFWRRIAVGAQFGTGSDSVVFPKNVSIGLDDVSPLSSRGKQVLGTDSLITAYLIFAAVGVVLGIVFYAVLTSPIPS